MPEIIVCVIKCFFGAGSSEICQQWSGKCSPVSTLALQGTMQAWHQAWSVVARRLWKQVGDLGSVGLLSVLSQTECFCTIVIYGYAQKEKSLVNAESLHVANLAAHIGYTDWFSSGIESKNKKWSKAIKFDKLQNLEVECLFQLSHFSPEDGGSMFLRNVGVDLRNHTTPKTKTTRSPNVVIEWL
jgi:hypothetical protein